MLFCLENKTLRRYIILSSNWEWRGDQFLTDFLTLASNIWLQIGACALYFLGSYFMTSASTFCLFSTNRKTIGTLYSVVMNWKGFGRQLPWPNRSNVSEFAYSEWENWERLRQIRRCPDWNSKQTPPDYDSRILLLQQPERKEERSGSDIIPQRRESEAITKARPLELHKLKTSA